MLTDLEIKTHDIDASRFQALEAQVQALQKQLESKQDENKLSVICFSGEWDRLFAALSIAAGGLAMGLEVHLFFTFWGLNALRASGKKGSQSQTTLQGLFRRIMPAGPGKAPLSRCNFGGLGKLFMRRIMRQKGVEDIDVLFNEVVELGAHFHVCDTSAELFGISCEEIRVGETVDLCGVATFLANALKSRMVLFI